VTGQSRWLASPGVRFQVRPCGGSPVPTATKAALRPGIGLPDPQARERDSRQNASVTSTRRAHAEAPSARRSEHGRTHLALADVCPDGGGARWRFLGHRDFAPL